MTLLAAAVADLSERPISRSDGGPSDSQAVLRFCYAQGFTGTPGSGVPAGKGALLALNLALAENDQNVKIHGFRHLVTYPLLHAFFSVNLGGIPLHVLKSRDTGVLLQSTSPLAAPAPKGGGLLSATAPLDGRVGAR
jgi:hypothetical protein